MRITTIFQRMCLIVCFRGMVPRVAGIDRRVYQHVRSGVVPQHRTVRGLALLLTVVLGGALVAGAVSEWPTARRPLRGVTLGFLVGTFGAVTFGAGLLFAREEEASEHGEHGVRETKEWPTGTTVSPEEAKRWLQKFLEEQQRRETRVTK